MTTVTDLLAFDPATWQRSAEWARKRAKTAAETQTELTTQAAAIDKAWPDPVGAMASAELREQAASFGELATAFDDGATVIDDAAGQMTDRKDELTQLQADVAGHPHLDGPDDHGNVRSTLPFPTIFPPDVPKIIEFFQCRSLAGQQTLKAREILMRADGHDRQSTIALMALVGIDLPPSTDGPIDLSDTGIVLQADLNSQDRYGDCVSLATLVSIAHSDPDFIREHMVYDPATGTYRVTLYEDGRPVTVSVDPDDLPADGSDQAGGTGNPSFLAVYEQALEQQFGDIEDGQTLETPMERITGQDSDNGGTLSPEEIREALDRDPPAIITTATSGAEDQPDDVDPTKRVVDNHAYTVRGVDADGNIVLQNPWGPNGGWDGDQYYPGEVHLTPDEYERWFNGSSVADLP